MHTQIIAILGWAGAGVLLLAYALVSAKRLTGDGWQFQLLNLAGGLALAINSAFFGAWPSAALNVVWVVIGTIALARLARLATARHTAARGSHPIPESRATTG